jgi:hypothetical protein
MKTTALLFLTFFLALAGTARAAEIVPCSTCTYGGQGGGTAELAIDPNGCSSCVGGHGGGTAKRAVRLPGGGCAGLCGQPGGHGGGTTTLAAQRAHDLLADDRSEIRAAIAAG